MFQLECVLAEETKAQHRKEKNYQKRALDRIRRQSQINLEKSQKRDKYDSEDSEDQEGRDYTAWEVECYGYMLDQGTINMFHNEREQGSDVPGMTSSESRSSNLLSDEKAANEQVFGILSDTIERRGTSKRVSKAMLMSVGLESLASKKTDEIDVLDENVKTKDGSSSDSDSDSSSHSDTDSYSDDDDEVGDYGPSTDDDDDDDK